MKVRKLDHYNIRTTKFDETVRFYVDVLGMRNGRPPGLPADLPPGWIYDDSDCPIVHLMALDPVDPEKSYANASRHRGGLDNGEPPAFRGSGAIDHIALECTDYDDAYARLERAKVTFYANDVPQLNLRQLFTKDPNGITLELNFR
jgi:catechol 2,3-dioxygenase-like lactoylglutathione lyase family enzyme